LRAVDLEAAKYGKSETKRSISNIVNAVSRSYRFTSIHEFNAVLKQYNIVADRGREGTLINSKGGLRYSLLNNKGEPVGVPIKASTIYGQPTLKNLGKQFELNEMLRLPHKQRVKSIVDVCLSGNPTSFDEFITDLVRQNIYPVIRQNDQDRIYGLTYVDNETKCVFNGSDLGKQYSANGIIERLKEAPPTRSFSIPTFHSNRTEYIAGKGEITSSPGFISDLMEAKLDQSASPSQLKRKRRKRKGRSI
jgi:hypothetical protein